MNSTYYFCNKHVLFSVRKWNCAKKKSFFAYVEHKATKNEEKMINQHQPSCMLRKTSLIAWRQRYFVNENCIISHKHHRVALWSIKSCKYTSAMEMSCCSLLLSGDDDFFAILMWRLLSNIRQEEGRVNYRVEMLDCYRVAVILGRIKNVY
jgi:hypothetical protein